jgi:protein-tyrosine phosphatase
MGWLPFGRGRRRSPWNNVGKQGLTCGQVTDQLYVGGELGPRDWEALAKEGVTVVVNLQQEQQDFFRDDERVESYLWLPAPDQLAPTIDQLALGVHFIRSALSAGKRIFVHCKAGQGRAPLLCACYLVSLGDSPMEAMTKVREARPSTMLTPEQGVRLREFTAARDEAMKARQAAPTLNGAAPDGATPEIVQEADRDAAEPTQEEEVTPAEDVTIEAVTDQVESIDDNIEASDCSSDEAGAETTAENADDPEMPVPHEPAAAT